jgi:hypothetical protein
MFTYTGVSPACDRVTRMDIVAVQSTVARGISGVSLVKKKVAKTIESLEGEEEEKVLREHKILEYSHGALRQR